MEAAGPQFTVNDDGQPNAYSEPRQPQHTCWQNALLKPTGGSKIQKNQAAFFKRGEGP